VLHAKESALNLHLDLERWSRRKEGGSGSNTRKERESDEMKKRVNTRRSAMVIMKAPTKLETLPLLISSRFTYVDCILTLRISLPFEDPGLRHIYLVRNVLCADARTRGDNRFPRGDSRYRFDLIAIVLESSPLCHDWQIYL